MRVGLGPKTFLKGLSKILGRILLAVRKSADRNHITVMNYLLAIALPPVSILLAGRPVVALLTFLIWIPALLFSGGLTHPLFILLAWLIIFQAREDRRERYAD